MSIDWGALAAFLKRHDGQRKQSHLNLTIKKRFEINEIISAFVLLW